MPVLDMADAWRLAERAAAFDPQIGSVWAIIAETAAENKRWRDAAHALEKAIALTPPGPGRTRMQAALNDARGKVDAMTAEEMKKVTGGMSLPPGLKLPF